MKQLFIVANWKSNKTIKETEEWLHGFHEGLSSNSKEILLENKEIVIAPSFVALEHANYCSCNLKLPIKLAAQNISPFDEGPYTGEVSAKQIKELADYVIVGHSERRRYFGEDEEMVNQKIEQALNNKLVPILCISSLGQVQKSTHSTSSGLMLSEVEASKVKSQPFDFAQDKNSKLKMMVAYEPLFAIGSGKPDTSENAESMSRKVKKSLGEIPVLYGGSVNPENVRSFTKMPNIDGVLIGGASLNPLEFLEIVKNA